MRYVGHRNPLAFTSPLRSLPLYRHPAHVFGTRWIDGAWKSPEAAPVAPAADASVVIVSSPAAVLANAEARLRESERLLAFACRELGTANRTRTRAIVVQGRVCGGNMPIAPERVRQLKADAFRLINKRRAELRRARLAVDAARATLGMPLMVAVAERAATKEAVRASKRVPVCRIAAA